MSNQSAERQLRDLATNQHGLFTLADIRSVGLSMDVLQRRLNAGTWEKLRRGVYRIGGAPWSYEQDLLTAVLENGPGAAASHRSAATLWAIPGFNHRVIEVTKPRGRNQRRSWGQVHGSTELPATHLTAHNGVPVTTPARTAFDLAGVLHPLRAERALDNILGKKLATVEAVQQVHDDLAGRGRAGSVVMRDFLEARGIGYVAPTSELEAIGRQVLRDGGLPEPAVERNLGDDHGWIGRVDLVYAQCRLVIELDSRRHHTALLDRDADLARDNRLTAAGWRILRFSWDDLTKRPWVVVAQIRAALDHRDRPLRPNVS